MDPLTGKALDAKLRELLAEDLGAGDVTSEWTVPAQSRARGRLIARGACVVSGLPIARRTFELLDPELAWDGEAPDGSSVAPGATLATLAGHARALLAAERFVEAVEGTGCAILDTRKTAPGLRAFDRMAVVEGGGANHRDGLYDMVLIKDNHRRLAGGTARAVEAALRRAPAGMKVEVEVESEDDLKEALGAGARMILIDNQAPETVAQWSRIAREFAAPLFIEASGNMTLDRVRAYALAGADAVSVGALTHSVAAADISLELDTDE
jgi:nicotinate-nucleotide pyrophosphorylase (carboxylating)